jgi:outer membrane protein assembly factor BamB
VLLNSVTGEVLASQTFPSDEAAADVEALQLQEGGVEGLNPGAPLALTLGGRLVIADPKQGRVLARAPENSVAGQAAGGFASGGDLVVLTAVRGGDKTPNAGLHIYRINPATGDVKWHAHNAQTLGTGNVLSNIVGDKVNGPYRLEQAKGVFIATFDKGVHLYDWEDGKERWGLNESLPYSYRVTKTFGNNSFAVIRSMLKNRAYVPTNPRPVEADGVVFAAGNDRVFAIDAASGKLKWESKSKSLGLISGLEAAGGTVIARQGLYADSNDFGAPTGVVTQLFGPEFEEEPEIYIEEGPYGYVGLDGGNGKESWKCLEFEAHDREMIGPMPKDSAICRVPKVSKEKGCKLGKLGIGKVYYSYATAGNVVYLGKDGIAGAPPSSCTASWKVEGSVKNLTKIYEVAPGTERKGTGFVQHGDPPYLITHYEKDVNVVDVAAGKILVTSDEGESVKVQWAKRMLFVAEGSDLAMFKLP